MRSVQQPVHFPVPFLSAPYTGYIPAGEPGLRRSEVHSGLKFLKQQCRLRNREKVSCCGKQQKSDRRCQNPLPLCSLPDLSPFSVKTGWSRQSDRSKKPDCQKTAHHIFIKQSGKKLYSFQGIGSIGKLADRLRSTVSLENMGKCRRIINKRCPRAAAHVPT